MVTVMTRATMCMALAAPWKMMELASSMLRAKQSGSIPTPVAIEVIGPMDEHSGNGAMWQMPMKSPNAIMGCGGAAGEAARRGRVGLGGEVVGQDKSDDCLVSTVRFAMA